MFYGQKQELDQEKQCFTGAKIVEREKSR